MAASGGGARRLSLLFRPLRFLLSTKTKEMSGQRCVRQNTKRQCALLKVCYLFTNTVGLYFVVVFAVGAFQDDRVHLHRYGDTTPTLHMLIVDLVLLQSLSPIALSLVFLPTIASGKPVPDCTCGNLTAVVYSKALPSSIPRPPVSLCPR